MTKEASAATNEKITENEKVAVVTASPTLAAAQEISVGAAVVAVLSELGGIFKLRERH